MSYQFITVARADRVTTITLSRPEVLNAIHPPMHAELQRALDDFADDGPQRVCVLTGAGTREFCAGRDLKYAVSHGLSARNLPRSYPRSGYGGIAARFDPTKPVIAAVNGAALGGGFEIMLACDLVIAVDEASFGLPEPLIGAVAIGGGLHRLARQIGTKPALGMILTDRPVTALEGRSLGFVNEVVTRADLAVSVDRCVRDILRCSPAAIEASKEAVYRGLQEPSLAAAIERVLSALRGVAGARRCAGRRARIRREACAKLVSPIAHCATNSRRTGASWTSRHWPLDCACR